MPLWLLGGKVTFTFSSGLSAFLTMAPEADNFKKFVKKRKDTFDLMIHVIAFSKLQPPLPPLFGAVLPKMPAFLLSFFFEIILTA